MHKRQLWVSQSFRDFVKECFGLPNEDQGNWRMLEYILMNPMYAKVDHDRIDRRVIAPHNYIKSTIYQDCHASAESLLKGFEEATGIKLNITPYEYKKQCRLLAPEIPDEVRSRADEEKRTPYKQRQNKVYFSSGECWTHYKERTYREQLLNSIMNSRLEQRHPAYELVEYLHSHQVQTALNKQVLVYGAEALQAINSIEDEAVREYASTILSTMQNIGYTQYKSVENTRRIYTSGANMLGLPKEIRNILLKGCYVVDLKNCQLAIVARIWDLPQVRAFLQSGRSIWKELCDFVGLDVETGKRHVKAFVYAALYGMSKSNLRNKSNEEIGNQTIFEHPLVQEILEERVRQLKLIRANKGGTDAFGEWRPVERNFGIWVEMAQFVELVEKNNRSVLCSIVQSYELKLMLEVFKAVKENPSLLMMAWLHDGMYIKVVNHREHAGRYFGRLQKSLEEACKSVGVDVEMEVEYVGI